MITKKFFIYFGLIIIGFSIQNQEKIIEISKDGYLCFAQPNHSKINNQTIYLKYSCKNNINFANTKYLHKSQAILHVNKSDIYPEFNSTNYYVNTELIYLDSDFKVIGVEKLLINQKIIAKNKAKYTLEMKLGNAFSLGIKHNQKIDIL